MLWAEARKQEIDAYAVYVLYVLYVCAVISRFFLFLFA